MSEKNYYTEEGLQKLKDELNNLKTKERPALSKAIDEARQKGDLSENAEYHAAKEAQGLMELKISKLQDTLGNAVILDDSDLDNSKVLILSTVKLKNLNINKEMSYTLVAENEADLKSGKLSIKTPIAQGLLGKEVGDKVEVDVPNGKMKFEILEISR
ncbi:MAG: transcription elongation factor GreA [Bacteroidetes bacterium]|nr:transcription elongation factor GreA [Bacteroidia bacterium]MBN4052323.1 transcription elongation factor GreA [Sphingobacteriaceae bacterium AH-315-L07]PCH69672.1 MAG: transcription elongation factor GreA [Bacteroidota bacterium]